MRRPEGSRALQGDLEAITSWAIRERKQYDEMLRLGASMVVDSADLEARQSSRGAEGMGGRWRRTDHQLPGLRTAPRRAGRSLQLEFVAGHARDRAHRDLRRDKTVEATLDNPFRTAPAVERFRSISS